MAGDCPAHERSERMIRAALYCAVFLLAGFTAQAQEPASDSPPAEGGFVVVCPIDSEMTASPSSSSARSEKPKAPQDSSS
jgi:hypothetical protein